MKKFLIPGLLVIGAVTVLAGMRFDANTWRGVQTFDPLDLNKSLGSHAGQLVGVRFNFRGKDIHHLKPSWYESSIWSNKQGGKAASIRVMVSRKDLPAFKSITTDSAASPEMTIYGRVLRDSDNNFLFVRVIGRKATVDSAGNAVVDW
jgi:hypothetical protein